ncbi:MAG: dipeptide ABC transporter ATP-binding protein [Hydrogenophilaceae bacterium]|jgi:oligopeptide/dipeptide ABC transporter ATP-binding protein|nr:dipeptide ABC transporter ATP-binding protein [Hydrogenophilaceae bacterium]
MTEPVLEIDRLSVSFDTPDGCVEAVKAVSLAIAPGECLGVVGESGSGKSQTFLSAFGLTAENARVGGAVKFRGRSILGLPRKALDEFRGRRVSFVFQDPLTALTPHLTVGAQMGEVLAHHFRVRGEDARKQSLDWLERVRIPEAARRLRQYPHELSGGMRQRVMIAMAMMGGPELLVADEPTTALDATVQAQVLDLIDDLRRDTGAAVALITHDMGVIARMAQRVIVMRRGEIVEAGGVDAIFTAPEHAYTRMLLDAAPRIENAPQALAPHEPGAPILEAKDVRVTFPVRVDAGLFGATKKLRAVDGVSFTLNAGETLGIVGESGCGKSTLARAIVKLLPRGRDGGAVTFLGRGLSDADRKAIRETRKDLQIVFQDPLASLDPRMTVGGSIAEPLLSLRPDLDRAARRALVRQAMADVGLDPSLINRYPHELSGGQNQRVGIARAVILKPKLIVCDEAVSALDVSIQAQIVALLIDLQKRMRLAMLFISHDLAVVRELSHKVLVLYLGRTVEQGPAAAILANPVHPYTKALLAASLSPDPEAERRRERVRLVGDLPSPLDTRAPLRFLKSKVIDDPDAEQYRPRMIEVAPGHWAAEFDPEPAPA